MKEREELNADKEEKETLEKIHDPDKPSIERNFYLNEALAITLDYLKLAAAGRATSPTAQVGSR